jgi:alpha-L-arabinofuranosidase
MADLQTALATALQEWEPETKQESKQMETKQISQIFKPTNNVTRETFNFIKAHYGCTSTQVKESMVARGFKKNSVHSLITQLVNAKQVIRDKESRLAAIVPEYMPMKLSSKKTKSTITKPKPTKKQKEMVMELATPIQAAPKVGTTLVKPETKPSSRQLTAQYVMDNINLYEAKALFKILRMVFEENF